MNSIELAGIFFATGNPSMTRHYTHVGELAAGRAVALLTDVMSEAKPEPTRRGQDEILRDVQAMLKTMTAANWKTKRAKLLDLCANKVDKN